MIFVTVGTHEQGMDRLLIELDKLVSEKKISSDIFAQIGYSKYKPKNYKYKELIAYDEMDDLVRKAEIVITHGGPGSIFHPLKYAKIPIVVPRNPIFNEHVDNHQILFAKKLEQNNKIIAVYDIENLYKAISTYKNVDNNYEIHVNATSDFVKKFTDIINEKFDFD